MVRRGHEFLVLLRCRADGGYWHTVAGAVESGESYREAAERELREEVGLVAELVDLDRTYVYDETVEVRAFLAETPPGWEPTLNEEHDDYRWCSREEAALLFHWPETQELVRAL
jgi:dATP pyrophosphohydrolase